MLCACALVKRYLGDYGTVCDSNTWLSQLFTLCVSLFIHSTEEPVVYIVHY